MKIIKLPAVVRGLIFDMDNTLYTNNRYVQHTDQALYGEFAAYLGKSLAQTKKLLAEYQDQYAQDHAGRKPSLSNSMQAYGVSINQSIDWRTQTLNPEQFLKPDAQLRKTLIGLAQTYRLSVVTNSPLSIARRVLSALNIADLLEIVVGLDTFGVSKPALIAFAHAISLMHVPAETVVSIGDRLEIDVEPALTLGAGGIVVESVGEIYNLANFLPQPE